MEITVLENGFVTGDFLEPLGYEGECNSRKILVTHPHFKDCYYQLFVTRFDECYKIGIQDGEAVVPPSLMRTATDLKCQFYAISNPNSVQLHETDTFVFMSQPFSVNIAKSLNPVRGPIIPTYEELQQMYKNIDAAQASVELAKKENAAILAQIEAALAKSREEPVAELSQEILEAYRKQFADVCEDYLAEGFLEDVTNEVIARIGKCECSEVGKMTTEDLTEFVKQIFADMKTEVSSGTAVWLTTSEAHHTMSQDGKIIGG